ncbi:hypothetical protein [Nocardia amamiensis]|nr:hypothetical protein [Nocardia amamiensis]
MTGLILTPTAMIDSNFAATIRKHCRNAITGQVGGIARNKPI